MAIENFLTSFDGLDFDGIESKREAAMEKGLETFSSLRRREPPEIGGSRVFVA